jgi:hypothetical protein
MIILQQLISLQSNRIQKGPCYYPHLLESFSKHVIAGKQEAHVWHDLYNGRP